MYKTRIKNIIPVAAPNDKNFVNKAQAQKLESYNNLSATLLHEFVIVENFSRE